jgi:hypothetical protein
MDNFDLPTFETNTSQHSETIGSTEDRLNSDKSQKTEKSMSLHYFGLRTREKYGVTPESFLELDLNALLIKDKVATYLYLAGDDQLEFVQKDSVLVIDRSLKPQTGNVVVVGVNGIILLRRLVKLYDPQKQRPLPALVTDKEGEPPIFLHPDYAEVHFKGVARSSTTFI